MADTTQAGGLGTSTPTPQGGAAGNAPQTGATPNAGGNVTTPTAPQPGADKTQATQPNQTNQTNTNGQGTTETQPTKREPTPEMREWQRRTDREREQMRQQMQNLQSERAQMAAQMEQMQLSGADDSQKAQHFAQKYQQLQYQIAQQQQAEQWRNWVVGESFTLVTDAGIDPKDERLQPFLDGAMDVSGLANIARGTVKILQQDVARLKREKDEEYERGKRDALRESGVLQTSSGTGGGSSEGMTPEKRAVMDEFEQVRTGKKRLRNDRDYADLKRRAQAAGVEFKV